MSDRPDSALVSMQTPTPFLKYGRWGDPHFRNFRMNADLSSLEWNSKNASGGAVRVRDMVRVELGQHSESFKRNKKTHDIMRSFLVYYRRDGTGHEQSVDLTATDDDIFQLWTTGLRWLIRAKDSGEQIDIAAIQAGAATRSSTTGSDLLSASAGASSPAISSSNAAMAAQMRSNMQAHQDLFTCGFGGWGQLGHSEGGHSFEDIMQPTKLRQEEWDQDVNVRMVSCGENHSAIVDNSGSVYTWGHSGSGRLGTASGPHQRTLEHAPSPVRLTSLSGTKIIAVACGAGHTLFLAETNQVYACGANDMGQLGLGSTADECHPQLIPSLSGITKIAAGSAASVALTSTGQMFTWGGNECGELGVGDLETRGEPTAVDTGSWLVSDVCCGDAHMLATATAESADSLEHVVLTWGSGNCGQLGHGDFEDRLVPTSVAILRGKELRSMSCGAAHCAVVVNMNRLEIGQLFVWGAALPATGTAAPTRREVDGDGAEQNVAIPRWIDLMSGSSSSQSGVVAVACGANHTTVLTDEGTLVMWGAGLTENGEPPMMRTTLDLGDTDAVAISCGGRHLAMTVRRKWTSDEDAPECMRCKAEFTLIKRRHHCRNCGGIFCKTCSNNFLPLLRLGYAEKVRLCDPCAERIRRGD